MTTAKRSPLKAKEEDQMSSPRIEHVNITVADAERTSALMKALFDWDIRWSGPAQNGGRTIHIGSNDHYLALHTPGKAAHIPEVFAKGKPLNHIAVEVDDLDAIEARVIWAGLKPFSHADYKPGRRFYFLDPDGIEYEVVSYTTTP
jgi:catechol 2,3-dioxygenase-like lactoylglutathione lyase family enzyme